MQTLLNNFPVTNSSDFAEIVRQQPRANRRSTAARLRILVLFGTRPETIKLAPIIHELERQNLETIVVSSGQHADLINSFVELFNLEVKHDLRAMHADQTPTAVFARVAAAFDQVLEREKPDFVVVQGDTTTALAGALAAFNRRVAVAHVEAGLRSGNASSPFPEEMNRRLIAQLATVHFAATEANRCALLRENVDAAQIFVTGNPVVDALEFVSRKTIRSEKIAEVLRQTSALKTVLLTTHRRESFGAAMLENMRVARDFVAERTDTALVFPVHPNPAVRAAANKIFRASARVFLLEPLDYAEFIALMKNAWLIISDSGGVQEEAPSLGKPLLVMRENTERGEAVCAGVAKLVGGKPERLRELLEENYRDETWINSIKTIKNPFGDGLAAKRIVKHLTAAIGNQTSIQK